MKEYIRTVLDYPVKGIKFRDITTLLKNSKHFSKLFYGALTGIFVAGLILITKNIGFWHIEFIDLTEPMHLLNNLIYKLPILLPLLWLAVFASKRRSEDRRLQQEYAHKEALAKSYQSFKQQIESLQSKDDALMKQLLERAIIAIAFNASTTLDGKHGEKAPLLGAVEKMAEKLTEKATEFWKNIWNSVSNYQINLVNHCK